MKIIWHTFPWKKFSGSLAEKIMHNNRDGFRADKVLHHSCIIFHINSLAKISTQCQNVYCPLKYKYFQGIPNPLSVTLVKMLPVWKVSENAIWQADVYLNGRLPNLWLVNCRAKLPHFTPILLTCWCQALSEVKQIKPRHSSLNLSCIYFYKETSHKDVKIKRQYQWKKTSTYDLVIWRLI